MPQASNWKPRSRPDPKNMQAFTEYMGRIQSMQGRNMMRLSLDMYQPNLYGSPTVYVLEERQIGQRTYPTRYVVLYQDQALRQPGYRLVWMTVTDEGLKAAQVASLKEEQQDLARKKEDAAAKKKVEELDALTKKKDDAEKEAIQEGSGRSRKRAGLLKAASASLLQTRHGFAVGRPLQIHLEHDRTIRILGLQADRHPIDHELGQRHGGDVRRLV